ncbi:MAG TPA: hypothetical protein VL359_08870 [bacterium]|nr:hypothetical protein [bacterium]
MRGAFPVPPALLLALGVALLTACSGYEEIPASGQGGAHIFRVTNVHLAEQAPDPALATLPLLQVQASLRRITVTYNRILSLVTTDPQPLLSEQQIGSFAAVIHAELSAWRPGEALEFRFLDAFYRYPVTMLVYPDGPRLVYRFTNLATMPDTLAEPPRQFMAKLRPQPGQEAVNHAELAWVADPVISGAREQALQRQAKLDLIAGAQKDGTVDDAEAARLQGLVDAHPQVALEAWQRYWVKRHALKNAQNQGVMEQADYQAQLAKLNQSLLQ